MRDRGGVLSSARTFSSRHEQQSASTAPSTTMAGIVAYSGLAIAARANTLTSSVRLTTAVPVSTTLRYVDVSRNGFRTITSSPHSTPIGAQLIVLWAPPETVVTMVSMITGESPNELDGRRHERRRSPSGLLGPRVGAVRPRRQFPGAGAAEEAIENPV